MCYAAFAAPRAFVGPTMRPEVGAVRMISGIGWGGRVAWEGVHRGGGGRADLEVGGGDGVACAVRVGEGVDEGVEGALDELDEGLLDGVLLGAVEDRVFEDVRDAGRVLDGGAEDGAKGLVLVAVADAHALRAGAVVAVDGDAAAVLLDELVADEGEALEGIGEGERLWGGGGGVGGGSCESPDGAAGMGGGGGRVGGWAGADAGAPGGCLYDRGLRMRRRCCAVR